RRDDRAARSPLVRRVPVPPRAQVPSHAPAPAVRRIRRRGAAAPAHRAAARGTAAQVFEPREPAGLSMTRHFAAAPFLIAGPCVVESDDLNLRVGETLAELGAKLGLHVVFKASYDKANRSRLAAPRGPGVDRGLRALEKVR